MNINLKTKDVELTDEIKAYLEDKMSSLIERYLARLDEKENLQLDCEISRESHHQKGTVFYVEVNLEVPGKILRAAKYATDIRSGIDIVEADLKRQIKKYREIKESKSRKSWIQLKNFLRGIWK
jgi:ribosomal subunit interface protein